MYQIVEIQPVHCQITDGIIGNTAKRLPNTYQTKELAHKLAGILSDREYDSFGDGFFQVVEYGACPFTSRTPGYYPEHDGYLDHLDTIPF